MYSFRTSRSSALNLSEMLNVSSMLLSSLSRKSPSTRASTLFSRASISYRSNPVSGAASPRPSSSSLSFTSSHWPLTLFMAMLSCFSAVSSRSTTETSVSVTPSFISTVRRWWPDTTRFVRLFQITGTTTPNLSMFLLSFSYSSSPGISSTRGLYSARSMSAILFLIISIR